MPIVSAHWLSFTLALSTALVAIVVRVMIPLFVGTPSTTPWSGRRPPHLGHSVVDLGILTVFGFLFGFVSRYFLFRTAYAIIDYDLRVLMYRHLTRMSFGSTTACNRAN